MSSATTNSTFAGVLAGFVFLGVATLITRPSRWNTQALGLLSCSFVVLGFDSYLFSLVSGSNGDPDCARVWGEGLPASGMLAVGGVAVVTGISWLLVVREGADTPGGTAGRHEAATEEPDSGRQIRAEWPDVRLDSIARWMAHGVSWAVALLLATTTADYGQFGFPSRDGPDVDKIAVVSAALVFLLSVGITIYRRKRDNTPVVSVAYWVSSYGLLGYAVTCTVFVGFVTNTSASSHAMSDIVVFLGLIAPAILLIALVQSIAPISAARDRSPGPIRSRILRLLRPVRRLPDMGENSAPAPIRPE